MPSANDATWPLTPDDCETCTRVIESTAAIREVLDKCGRCGFDVAALQDHNNKTAVKAAAIKREWFPAEA